MADVVLVRAITPARARAIRHGLILSGLVWVAFFGFYHLSGGHSDIHDYWLTDPSHAYRGYVLGAEGQAYTPAWTLAFAPFTRVPYPLLYAAWFVMNSCVALWLLRPVPSAWRLPAMLLLSPELFTGNVHLLIAASIVLALGGAGWAWAFPILTKVTPAIGLLWHLARREWASLFAAAGATAALALASAVVAPDLWSRWWQTIMGSLYVHGPEIAWIPLLPRIPVAVVLTWFAGRTDRPWIVPLAVIVGMPHVFLQSFAVTAAVPRLLRPVQTSPSPSPDVSLPAVAA